MIALLLLPLLAQASVRQSLDDWDLAAALPAARQAVAQSPDNAEALDLLGEALSLAGDPSALSTLEAALKLKKDPGGIAQTRLRMGAELALRRNAAGALEEYKAALAIFRDAHALLGAGTALSTLGRYAEARAALDEALALAVNDARLARDVLRALSTLAYLQNNLALAEQTLARVRGSEHPVELAQTQLLEAGLALERGRYEEAGRGLAQALAFFEQRLGGENRRLLPVLRNIARNQRFQGQLLEAIRTSERALAISVRSFGENSTSTAELLGILAAAQAESGLLSEARRLYDRAIAVLTEIHGPNHAAVGVELFSLANLEQVMGDFESSLRHAGQALAIREAIDGKESARTVTIYSLLGRVNALNGQVAKGRQLVELAVAIGRRTVGEAHPRTIFARSDLGEVLYVSKDYAGALEHFTAALAGQTKLFGAGNIRTAQGLYNLALAERAVGHHAEALDRFGEAGRIWREAFGADYVFLAETNAGQAASLMSLGRPAEALAPALESARVRRASLDAVVMTAAEREALLFARVDRDGLLLALDLVARGLGSVSDVWDALIHDRAAVLDAMARRRPSPRIAALKKELAQAVLIGDPKLYQSRVASIRQELDAAERAAARESDRGTRAGRAEVMAALPVGSALIGYARGESQYVAFVARPGSEPRVFGLGAAVRIDALVRGWQQEIERERNSAGRNARRNEESYRVAGVALRRAIWDPLQAALGGAKQVFVALDGALQLVNLDTLPVGSTQYLAETGPLLQIVSSERDLAAASSGLPGQGSLLALGGADFSRVAPVCEVQRFLPLPGSGAEALAVASAWRSRGGAARVLTGAGATKAALVANAGGQRVIHLATHGFFLSRACQQARESALAENPLLRSGLVLSGGLLTAEEVSALRLDATELVVLSGCDTARGTSQAGEGLLGLRRAFRAAGVRQVVSSLWPVEDVAARQWMLRFYQGRRSGVAQAVQAASVAELRGRRAGSRSTHPFYWGGFVASGY